MLKKIALSFLLCIPIAARANSLDLQVLEKGSPAVFYDWQTHQWQAGIVSPFLVYKSLSLDIGAIKNIEESGSGIPLVGLNLHLGDYLAKLPLVIKVADLLTPDVLTDGLLGKLSLGAFGAREADKDLWHYGAYTGLEIKF